MKIRKVAFHRNGVGGAGFHVVLFREGRGARARQMAGFVFAERHVVAVIDAGLLAAGVIREHVNSWRGDEYEPELRKAVLEYERGRASVPVGAEEVEDLLHGTRRAAA